VHPDAREQHALAAPGAVAEVLRRRPVGVFHLASAAGSGRLPGMNTQALAQEIRNIRAVNPKARVAVVVTADEKPTLATAMLTAFGEDPDLHVVAPDDPLTGQRLDVVFVDSSTRDAHLDWYQRVVMGRMVASGYSRPLP